MTGFHVCRGNCPCSLIFESYLTSHSSVVVLESGLGLETGLESSKSWSRSWTRTRTLRTRPETRSSPEQMFACKNPSKITELIMCTTVRTRILLLLAYYIDWDICFQLTLLSPPFCLLQTMLVKDYIHTVMYNCAVRFYVRTRDSDLDSDVKDSVLDSDSTG